MNEWLPSADTEVESSRRRLWKSFVPDSCAFPPKQNMI